MVPGAAGWTASIDGRHVVRMASAPRAAVAGVPAGQPLPAQDVAHSPAVHEDEAKEPAVPVAVALNRPERDGPVIQEPLEPHGRPIAQRPLARAPGFVRLGSVAVGDPDLPALEPDRVAIAP